MTQGPPTRDPTPPLPAHVYAGTRDWDGYSRSLAHLGPRETLLFALARFDVEGPARSRHAIDLGCGDGRDTAELLRRGWTVEAIDGHEGSIRRLLARPELTHRERLTARVAGFEGLTLGRADLVNASFSLPFCPPAHFAALWSQVVGALPSGGRFAGQFFGDKDDWAGLPDRTHHTVEQVRDLLGGFEVEHWQEEARDSRVDPAKYPKRWHVFHVVARKR